MICEMALILALDVSGSVSGEHYRLQRDATAAAVREMVRPNPHNPIAIQVIMWEAVPHLVLPWRVLRNTQEVQQLSSDLEQVSRPGMNSTNMTTLMRSALDSYDHVPCEAERLVLDISGDGASDEADLDVQKQRAEHMGVQVNGLPIVTDLQPLDIVEYFRSEVITWDGFVIPSNTWQDYMRAIRGKLALEVARPQD